MMSCPALPKMHLGWRKWWNSSTIPSLIARVQKTNTDTICLVCNVHSSLKKRHKTRKISEMIKYPNIFAKKTDSNNLRPLTRVSADTEFDPIHRYLPKYWLSMYVTHWNNSRRLLASGGRSLCHPSSRCFDLLCTGKPWCQRPDRFGLPLDFWAHLHDCCRCVLQFLSLENTEHFEEPPVGAKSSVHVLLFAMTVPVAEIRVLFSEL